VTFLHPLILLASLGISLPILAHLLNRHQVQHTPWAAMQFLNRNVRVRSRQIRLRDLILLLMRCAALLLLVLALARPAWQGSIANWFPGESRAGVVIGIDASFSMAHGDKDQTRFRRALGQVAVIAKNIQPGDPVSVVLLGGENKVLARNMAFDQNRFSDLIETAKIVPAGLDLDRVPGQLKELADDMEALNKEIYFVTDIQARDWNESSTKFQSALADLGESGQVFLAPVPGIDGNLAMTELELVSGVLRKGAVGRYQATVKNYGTDPVTNVEVQCRVEGVQIDTKTIPIIAAGASETVSLFVPFHNSGPTRITAEITGDLLPTDNIRRVVAVVRDRVSVLCVDGTDGTAGRLLMAALLARSDGSTDENFQVKSIPWLSLPSEPLEEIDVVILADVPEITEQQTKQLSQYVRQGNGLVWFAGKNVKANIWNERSASNSQPLLPAKLGLPVDVSTGNGAGRPLDPSMPDHPLCLPLRSLPEDLFSETRFLTRLDSEIPSSSFPILKLAGSGDPILLEHSLGRGQVFMFTTSAETSWNNMALTPVFPMLMQQMVTYLAGREFEPSQTVGDSLSLAYEEQPDASDAVFDSPSDELITVPVREHRKQFVALLENAREAGFYEARVSVQAPGLPIAVNIDSEESNVSSLTTPELNQNLDSTNIIVAPSEAELASAIQANRTQKSSWRQFMLIGLILLIAESFFADRLQKRKQLKGPTDNSNLGGQDG